MGLPVFYTDEFLRHDTGWGHPERPDRLRAAVAALQAAPFADRLEWRSPTPVGTSPNDRLWTALLRAHNRAYLAQVRAIAEGGGGRLDGDTPLSAASYEVALLAVQAWLEACDEVLASGGPALALVRPPGHHALSDRGMGFCLFSNAAIAALEALHRPEVQRVAILDWDVHHGNGTEAIVAGHSQIAFCSLHQSPAYPGTGQPDFDDAAHQVLNLPVPPASDFAVYRSLFEESVLPFLQSFAPDVLLVSAGYDANRDDPLAEVHLLPADFGWLAEQALTVTSRVVFGLEGGYDLASLGASIVATAGACLA